MITTKYYELLGLKKNPFSILPDPELFYVIDSQLEAMNTIMFAIENESPMARLYGEPGIGKTALLKYMAEKLKTECSVSYVALTPITTLEELVKEMFFLNELPKNVKSVLDRELDKLPRRKRKKVVIIDEAQDMGRDMIFLVKYIIDKSFQDGKASIFFLLSGTEELRKKLEEKPMRSVAQRGSFSYTLKGIKKEEIKGYMEYRLRKCNYKGPFPFSEKAIKAIWKFSSGNPRKVNILAERSLLSSMVRKKNTVGVREVKEAYRDLPREWR